MSEKEMIVVLLLFILQSLSRPVGQYIINNHNEWINKVWKSSDELVHSHARRVCAAMATRCRSERLVVPHENETEARRRETRERRDF